MSANNYKPTLKGLTGSQVVCSHYGKHWFQPSAFPEFLAVIGSMNQQNKQREILGT